MKKQIISGVILAMILLTGTSIIFWQAGFFNDSPKEPACFFDITGFRLGEGYTIDNEEYILEDDKRGRYQGYNGREYHIDLHFERELEK